MAENPNTRTYQTPPEPQPVSPPAYDNQNEASMPAMPAQGFVKEPGVHTYAPSTRLGIPVPQKQFTGETKTMPAPVSMPSSQQQQQFPTQQQTMPAPVSMSSVQQQQQPPTQQQAMPAPVSMPAVQQQQQQFPTEQKTMPPPAATLGSQPPKVETEKPGFQRQAPPQNRNAAVVGREYRDGLFARCARGEHDRSRKFGVCGIITAIFCFPLGLICCFADTQTYCARCGLKLD